MAWGAAATGTPAATGSTGPGPLADAGVARRAVARADPARRAQHGPRAGRLLPGHTRRRPRRLPPPRARADGRRRGGRAHPAGVPPRADAGATRCCLRRLLPRAHHAVGGDRRRSTVDPLPATDWALDGSTGGTGRARLLSPLGTAQATRRRGLRPRASTTPRARAPPPRWSTGIEPLVDVGHVDDADVVVVAFGTPGPLRAGRGASSLRADGAKVGWVRPISLFPFPSEAVVRGGRRCPRRRGLREQPGPDDRRRAPRGARVAARSTSSAGSASTARASASRPISRSRTLRARIEEVLG